MTLKSLFLAPLCGLFVVLAALTQAQAETQGEVALRFAVLGDAEPKPLAEFPGMAAAVADINALAAVDPIDFVVGVGDIPHKGTLIQYVNATPVLRALDLPFYPIMGNEEHGSTVARFIEFAQLWNEGKGGFESPKYVIDSEEVALVFASADMGRDFDDAGIDWIINTLENLGTKPVILIVHGAQAGAYPERADKGVHHPRFVEVLAQANLKAILSGDLHMDMDRSVHSKEIDGIHYLHAPALERTKVPDESSHIPRFRVVTVFRDGAVAVETYRAGAARTPEAAHHYRFRLDEPRTEASR